MSGLFLGRGSACGWCDESSSSSSSSDSSSSDSDSHSVSDSHSISDSESSISESTPSISDSEESIITHPLTGCCDPPVTALNWKFDWGYSWDAGTSNFVKCQFPYYETVHLEPQFFANGSIYRWLSSEPGGYAGPSADGWLGAGECKLLDFAPFAVMGQSSVSSDPPICLFWVIIYGYYEWAGGRYYHWYTTLYSERLEDWEPDCVSPMTLHIVEGIGAADGYDLAGIPQTITVVPD